MPILVHANTATAARRRVFFDLRDAADGITPETGEAGGQPQISTNGGAWTDTGIGTLTAIGNGRYYADLTQEAVATAGDLIETRYKSANTAESPGDSVQVVGFDPASALSTLTAQQVWDEALSGHATAGTAGKALSDAGAAGDPWSAPVRTLTQSAAEVVSAVTGEAITVLRGDRLTLALTGIGSLVGRSKLWFCVKGNPERDTDAQAVLLIEESAGLLRLNGAVPTSTDGSITVTDAAEGNLTITLLAAAAAQLPARSGMRYDVQVLVDGEPVTRVSGTFSVVADVTRATS